MFRYIYTEQQLIKLYLLLDLRNNIDLYRFIYSSILWQYVDSYVAACRFMHKLIDSHMAKDLYIAVDSYYLQVLESNIK